MKIVILGGGITGLTAAHLLVNKGHEVTVFEREKVLGGLASGFKGRGWGWALERSYHHIFDNDDSILDLAREIGYHGFFFSEPQTTSLYRTDNNYRTFTVDTPQDFLKFPLLSLPEKMRAGAVVAFLKLSPFLSLYEKQTAAEFLQKSMGEKVWEVMWEELFRKKFGKYAGNILASFIWARIKKRSKRLGYPTEGFQGFIDFLGTKVESEGGIIWRGQGAKEISRKKNKYYLTLEEGKRVEADVVISTLPTPVLVGVADAIFPAEYKQSLRAIEYSHAVGFVIESETPYFRDEYWVSLCDRNAPMMVAVQHTNFIDKKHYNGRHLLYIGNYVTMDDPMFTEASDHLLKRHLAYLGRATGVKPQITDTFFFRMAYAQPLFNRAFLKHMPHFETPAKGFYVANLDMTYPYDRGTNYAVRLGKQVAGMV